MRRRPWLAAVGLSAVVLFSGSSMAHADPVIRAASDTQRNTSAAPPDAPDSGARPEAGSTVPGGGAPDTIPGGGSTIPSGPTPAGPMGSQIMLKTAQVQSLAEQAKQVQQRIDQDKRNITTAKRNLDLAQRTLSYFSEQTDHDARRAYQNAAKVPDPLDPLARQWRELSKVAPWMHDPGTRKGHQSASSYQDAKALTDDAKKIYDDAVRNQHDDQSRLHGYRRQYQQATHDLQKLRDDNADALASLAAQQRAYDQQFAGEIGSEVGSSKANPRAVAAVRFALRQLGKPYVWGAEGPNSYDCSGLVLASYLSAGIQLPRVADAQYRATASRPVPLSRLLPGDLIFYGDTPGVSTSIYHVAMYIGHGKVVQAPTFGIPVQVVHLSVGGMYGATRVLPASGHVGGKPTPSPKPSRSGPKPTPSPSGSGHGGSPTPSGSATPTPTGSGDTGTPDPSASASSSPSTSASASASASTTSSAAPSASSTATSSSSPSTKSSGATTSGCPSPSASPSPSPNPPPSRSPSPSPSPSCPG